LIVGLLILLAADVILAFAAGIWAVALGAALWGLHMGFTQGLLSALVADTAPTDLRGTAYGVFNLTMGLTLLLASVIAGMLWDVAGPQGTFLAGAAFTILTLAWPNPASAAVSISMHEVVARPRAMVT
jgi:MFS family permease